MAIVTPDTGLHSFEAHKKVGLPNGYGRILYGISKYGINDERAGIYRTAHHDGRRFTQKMKFYRPTNPQTEAQQTWRGVFADGVLAWQNLTPAEKAQYNESAKPRKLNGFMYYMRLWLKSH